MVDSCGKHTHVKVAGDKLGYATDIFFFVDVSRSTETLSMGIIAKSALLIVAFSNEARDIMFHGT